MQKVINVLALMSFGVSAAIVAGGVYAYQQKDALIESVKENITKEIQGIVQGSLIEGLNSDVPSVPGVESPTTGGVPNLPF